jgi:ClpP class serine protease
MPAKAWGEDFEVLLFGDNQPRPPFLEEGRYAVVDVCGPLSQKPGWWTESYEEIRSRVAAALASKCEAVCLRIDSPGGDYAGALECARDLRAMAAAAGKKLVSFTDSMALSAGYAVACAASEIVTTESGQVGSIGVWAPLLDLTAADAMNGVKYSVVASGKAKVDRNPHVGITDEAFARLQAQIDDMAANFFALVAESRPGLSIDKIRALDGAEFFGSRGMAAGLSDRIVNSWSAFVSEKPGLSQKGASMSKYDEAMGALKRAAEGDDEDAKKAKRALKAIEDGDKPSSEEEMPEEKPEEKTSAEPADKDKEAEEAKSLARSLAAEVAALKAKNAAREAAEAKAKADAERAEFFATRPDLSAEQRKSLDGLPIEQVKAIVATWPRVHAAPGSALAALTPTVSGGERAAAGYTPRLSAAQVALIEGARGIPTEPPKAHSEGTAFVTPFVTKEQARKRLEEMKKGAG